MSKVIIKKMALHYFKGIKNLEIEFNENETKIAGPNGSGKSTIADAFTWLLWGKNMAGESDTKFLIKTVDEKGEEIQHVDHEVEAELLVDGNELKLRRVLVPEYNKNDELKGNHTDYYYNDVPMKKADFDAKIKGIIEETAFKFITSPFAFLNLEWKKQREILLGIAGDIDDDAIAEGNDMFVFLVETLRQKNITIDEFKQMIANQLSRVNERMNNIPARIDEVQRSMPEIPNYAELTQEEAQIIAKLNDIDKSIADLNNGLNKEKEEARKLAAEKMRILDEAERANRAAIHDQNVKHDTAKMHLEHLVEENRIKGIELQSKEQDIRRQIKALQDKGLAIAEEMNNLREEWKTINAREFAADTTLVCPLFGKACNDAEACAKYDNEQGSAFEAFCKDKENKKAAITEKGKALKVQLEALNPMIADCEAKIESLKKEYSDNLAKNQIDIDRYDQEMKDNPRMPLIAKMDPNSIQEWVELNEKEARILAGITEPDTSSLTSERMVIINRLSEIKVELAKKDQVETADKRVKELEEELKSLGAEKAELEIQRTTANDFEVARMNEVSSKVNGMFKIVTWQMFQRQVNGENVPACVALVNGVRWSDANNAARINAGIDVAATLARASNASAPMFIDNTESVAEVYNPGEQQRILLEFDRNAKSIIIN